jgi:hypothetical protein
MVFEAVITDFILIHGFIYSFRIYFNIIRPLRIYVTVISSLQAVFATPGVITKGS